MKAIKIIAITALAIGLVSCKEEVQEVFASSVYLNPTTVDIPIGRTVSLSATVFPENTTNKTITWSSSDETVATVQSGTVSTIKIGQAIIKATCGDKYATCVVNVIPIEVDGITINTEAVTLKVGEAITVTATVKPDNATDKTITWSSSDESVATVQNGTITALKTGQAIIKAACGNKVATCVVNVIIVVEEITLNTESVTLKVGETFILTAMVKPEDATDKTITWTSSDESVATVQDGTITTHRIGQTIIEASCGDQHAACVVDVVPVAVEGITLNVESVTLKVGESVTLTATVKPNDATDKTVAWETSNSSIATVSEGTVTAKTAGTAIITARAGDKTATCVVSIALSGNHEGTSEEDWDDLP
ncbi:MAG: Ig domain-containing protein [Bacteroidales bacterium]|nr:Ig domain-containing protein [Bacteroidales bacterium]